MDVDNTSSAKFPCKNVEKVAESQVESNVNIVWGKSLKEMPLFSIKEIEIHRKSSGKGSAIIKTLDYIYIYI